MATEQEKWYLENIVSRMEAGDMVFSGSYDEPDYELMTAGDIQFHLDSGMVDGHPEVLEKFAELAFPLWWSAPPRRVTPGPCGVGEGAGCSL